MTCTARITLLGLLPGGSIHYLGSATGWPGASIPVHCSGNGHVIAKWVQALATEPEIPFQSSIWTCAEDK